MRYFIQFAYNGTKYHGWQVQPNASSVQETLTYCLNTLFRESFEIVGAGRTDAGVHATKMYAHFDLEKDDLEVTDVKCIKKINSFLPEDITVYKIFEVAADAHARFDATERTYEYHIHTFKNSFLKDLSCYHFHSLDIEAMNRAAKILLDYTDFECFSKTHTDVFTFNCEIYQAYWKQENDRLIFTISANRFLRNMVRAIVGTLINIGMGKLQPEDMHHIIQSKNRGKAGFSVPAHGLYLIDVKYPYIP
ncbi:tRNA pseudouridine(38-40) synthase TruA [Capnocytophaga sp. ARDL2]|uniref:tRNA pseudouridine(38-40) synthase TruA n=1 Tax=Capnocytophaga sp. ARDL2 TaxID=3238809 RepID=UPI003557DB12